MPAVQDSHDVKHDTTISPASDDLDVEATKEANGLRDVAADLFLEINQYSPEELAAERKIVKRKLDMIIMPMRVGLGLICGEGLTRVQNMCDLLLAILRQAVAELCGCIHFYSRSWSDRTPILMGGRHLQFWLSCLGYTGESSDPTTAHWQADRDHDLHLEYPPDLACRRKELWRYPGFAILTGYGRSGHQSVDHEHRIYVLYSVRAALAHVHLSGL